MIGVSIGRNFTSPPLRSAKLLTSDELPPFLGLYLPLLLPSCRLEYLREGSSSFFDILRTGGFNNSSSFLSASFVSET